MDTFNKLTDKNEDGQANKLPSTSPETDSLENRLLSDTKSLYNDRKYAVVINYANAFIANGYKNNPEIYFMLGRSYGHFRLYDKAIESLNEFLKLATDNESNLVEAAHNMLDILNRLQNVANNLSEPNQQLGLN